MNLETIKLDKALNQAYLKQSLKRDDIELFKRNFKRLFERINENESEEHNKNIVSDFLKNTFYKENYEINTAGRKDLVIHKGNTSESPVSVIIEAKSPTNKAEMMSLDKPNAKALQEIIHYYLKERIINQNKEIKHLIITNIYEWFIFDALDFENYFYANKNLRKSYQEWIDKELVGTKTDWFYTEIAKPFIETELESLQCVHINLLDYADIVKNTDQAADSKLINLYKILSPEHLLKLPFANDYNKIDAGFYNELLYILGLEETKQNGKKLITRVKEKERQAGSLLENTIVIMQSLRRLTHIERLDLFGDTEEEQIFSIALELNIIWLNRILFLKLLEAQLIKYHSLSRNSEKGNKDFAFLNYAKIRDFDELNELFFDVLAKKPQNRTASVNAKFGELPYLNSSLFEQTELEDNIIYVSGLKDRLTLPTANHTVLKDKQGNRLSGELNTLNYLFEFLNAYSFANDTAAQIQDDNRTIINSAVLGLIFEKINGYKDGSFYTPSFITTFISRSVLTNSLVTNFSKALNKPIADFEQLKELIEYTNPNERQKANDIFNSLKIVDPAVGSGHFLVSTLNELIALKSELRILQDQHGNRLRGLIIQNINDELLIINEETSEQFQYYVNDKHIPPIEIQEIQQTLFNEKRTLIENCLFGVDINPKSVLICRLRMWIELLKNSFYTAESNFKYLETLPNIDINIKAGNSLISKFDTGLNIFERKAVNNLIVQYKLVTDQYKINTGYDQKLKFRTIIENIKTELLKYVIPQDKYYKLYLQKKDELGKYLNIKPQSDAITKQIVKLSGEVAELEKKYTDNYYYVYANSLEWAIDFPEILSENGEFIGFDIVLGNPPYIQLQKDGGKLATMFENMDYETFTKTGDIYSLFYEKGMHLLKSGGLIAFITSNKWMRAGYGKQTRKFFTKYNPIELIDLGSGVFDSATVDTCVLILEKAPNKNNLQALDISNEKEVTDLSRFADRRITLTNLTENSWTIANILQQSIKQKIEAKGTPLKDWDINIYRGVLTGYNEAFIIDGKKKDELIAADPRSAEVIKPILRGRDIKRYKAEFADLWLIYIPKGFTIKSKIETKNNIVKEPMPRYGYVEFDEAWEWFKQQYTAIASHLLPFKSKAQKRADMGDYWWEQRACAYLKEFEKEKIVWASVGESYYTFVEKNTFLLDTNYFFSIDLKTKYLLGILNSQLIIFIMNGKDTPIGTVAYRHYKYNLEELSVPQLSATEQQPFIDLVEKILQGKEKGEDTAEYEKQIDRLVYKLYELTDEEIQMIENGTK